MTIRLRAPGESKLPRPPRTNCLHSTTAALPVKCFKTGHARNRGTCGDTGMHGSGRDRQRLAGPDLASPPGSPAAGLLRRLQELSPSRWVVGGILLLSLCGCTTLSEYIDNGFKVGPNYKRPPAPVA